MRKRIVLLAMALLGLTSISACGEKEQEGIVLRVSNWEEYIDLGEWDEEELIELDNGMTIFGENSLIEDFEIWYEETYGRAVTVEYSTFGTNEELYNQITMGDTYDLVCPSEYMIMKMMREDMLQPYSEAFFDETKEDNYYIRNLSPYIADIYENLNLEGKVLADYAAGYMWGTLGIVYNPEIISEEEASSWKLLLDESYAKQVTIKDSVRDAYFAGNSIYNQAIITNQEFLEDEAYEEKLSEYLNATDQETIDGVEDILSQIKDNVYSFETDSGKADMVTGKVVANQQWSGDAVYTMDQAEEDGVELNYAAPLEATNLWFDGWAMLKKGVQEDPEKQHAAEAFVNYISMPENAARNMYYIGYTSVIAGGMEDAIFQYLNWCYGAEDEEEELIEYDLNYFFAEASEDSEEDYSITAYESQTRRQLGAQYPSEEVIKRSVVMECFEEADNARINKMWTNVRCFDIGTFINSLFHKEDVK